MTQQTIREQLDYAWQMYRLAMSTYDRASAQYWTSVIETLTYLVH